MDNDKIPYIAFEAEMARHERTIKRLLVALAISIALINVTKKSLKPLQLLGLRVMRYIDSILSARRSISRLTLSSGASSIISRSLRETGFGLYS